MIGGLLAGILPGLFGNRNQGGGTAAVNDMRFQALQAQMQEQQMRQQSTMQFALIGVAVLAVILIIFKK